MKKVYGYIRVSTAKQGEGVSLIAQKDAITRYASQYKLEIVEWFEEKETAAKQGRPLFNKMMKLLQLQKAAGVIIHKIDRGARNLKDWADLGNLIDKGVEVHFAHESLDLQARGGRLSADIQAVIASDYIRNLRQEAIKGLYGRLKQGLYPFHAPIGYRDLGRGKFKEIDLIQGPLVRKAFELYASKKYTLETLSIKMEAMGLKNIRQNKVDINGLSLILNNPFYMGIIKIKESVFAGGHQPLVSPSLFQLVQTVLKGNGNQKILKHRFTYRQVVSCHFCGYSLIGEIRKSHIYYRCHTKNCLTKSITEPALEALLLKAFASIELLDEEINTLISHLHVTERKWVEKNLEVGSSVKMAIGLVEQKLDRLTDLYLEEKVDKDIYERKKQELAFSLRTKQEELKNISSGNDKTLKRIDRFLEYSKNLKTTFKMANIEEKNHILQIVTSDLKVEGKKLVFSMKSPFLEMHNRCVLASGDPDHYRARIDNTKITYQDVNTCTIIGEKLPKDKLEALLEIIVERVTLLPETEAEKAIFDTPNNTNDY